MAASTDRSSLKILGLLGSGITVVGAVDMYRITLPFTYLNNKNSGMQCGWMPMQDAAQLLYAGNTEAVFGNNIIVLARPIADDMEGTKEFISALRVRGAKVVYEVDDDYSGLNREPEEGRTCLPLATEVDAITVTTKPLAKLMSRLSGGRPVYIVPNAIEFEWFAKAARTAERKFPDRLTIMLAGTRTHKLDWKVLQTVVPKLQANYPEAKFLVAGYQYEYMDDWDFEFMSPVHYSQYPAMLAQADILCAPLNPDDQFNASKSPIKAIEGWSAARRVGKKQGGCAVIATDSVVYRGTVQNRHNGLLVKHTPEAWYEGLSKLIEDTHLRQKLQVEGLKDAHHYDIATRWVDWHQAYTSIGGTR